MEKVTLKAENVTGLIDWREILVNTYMPDNVYCHVISREEAETVDNMASENKMMKKFLVDLLVDELHYQNIKKGDIIFMSSKSSDYPEDGNPKHIGVFDGFDVTGVYEDGHPQFGISLHHLWSVGSKIMRLDGDVPNIEEKSVSYVFLPDSDIFKNTNTVDYIRIATEKEIDEYRKAVSEYIDKTYCQKKTVK